MDTFENNETQQPLTPPPAEEVPETTYHASGAGRKESPYADSPYVAQPKQEYTYQPQYQPPKPKKEKRPGRGKRILSWVLVLVLMAGSCGITAVALNSHWQWKTAVMQADFNYELDELKRQIDQIAPAGSSANRTPLADGETLSPADLYAQNVSSVVSITCTITRNNSFYGITEGTSSGSGFILSSDGYVVTNHHVIEGASSIEVGTHDGTSYKAEVVGSDATNDLAVLKVEAENLPAAQIGRSSDLVIGDMVVAIGNPLGTLNATQTVGYVSGINREVSTSSTIINMIQTDAAINPGNSGGPLFNMRGEVIGITTAKYSNNSSSGASIEGLGFAIPIDDVMPAISQLVDNGFVSSAYLNIMVKDTDPSAAALYNLPTGAYVDSVGEGGAADRAGIQPKDIIIDLGGTKISNRIDLTRALRNYSAGDTTTITVVRAGAQITLDITLDEKPRETAPVAPSPEEMPSSGNYDEWYDFFRDYFGK